MTGGPNLVAYCGVAVLKIFNTVSEKAFIGSIFGREERQNEIQLLSTGRKGL